MRSGTLHNGQVRNGLEGYTVSVTVGPVYRPYVVDYVRDGEYVVDHNARYLGNFRTEDEAVTVAIEECRKQPREDRYAYIERYRWVIDFFEDDEYGTVMDAYLEQDDSYSRELEPT